MYAQLDLWRTAAAASSPVIPTVSSESNIPAGYKKTQQLSTLVHQGINTSPFAMAHEETMSQNIPQCLNSSVHTPPPLMQLQPPPPYQQSHLSIHEKPQKIAFGSSNITETPLPDISVLQSKNEKFELSYVLDMFDARSSSNMGTEGGNIGIKKEQPSAPFQYAAASVAQPPSSSYGIYGSLTVSPASNTTSVLTQSSTTCTASAAFQQQTLKTPRQMGPSHVFTNTGGNVIIRPPSTSSLQIINTSSKPMSSHPQESLQQKHAFPVLSQHIAQLLPPPYPGTVPPPILDQSNIQSNLQQSHKPLFGHNEAELMEHQDPDDEVDEEEIGQAVSPTQEHALTPSVTISPVSVSTGTPNISGRTTSNIHLWQFIKDLLLHPESHSSCIHWVDRDQGIFKIVDSVRVATLWGKRKNRPAMNYDKLSRSLRQYYKKGIMKKTERTQRLVYQFCHPYHL